MGVTCVGTCWITCPSNTNCRASCTGCAGSPTANTSTIASPPTDHWALGNVVHYFVGDPVQETFDDFVTLGRALRENGRFPISRPLLQISGSTTAAVARRARCADFRRGGAIQAAPRGAADRRGGHRRPPQPMAGMAACRTLSGAAGHPGTAGAWTFGVSSGWQAPAGMADRAPLHHGRLPRRRPTRDHPHPGPAGRAALAIRAVRPVFAGPLRTMINWEAWP